ncbi:hypothetical protein PILCRDRAFT_17365 [Piloderma croceum F 1598]|uniref:Uncharacterized protein n=1 Tax=Piloderma croceum (strain F 1598) TaxID=765440 RepID=A0A0C3ESQ7_PILCF|nr:hypothetical protein PILCRDRAFT_17365 [Piloderma croceum F 1598]
MLKLDTTLGTLRNRSVRWMVNAYRDINNKDLILQAWEMCRVSEFNLSHASLTSAAALTALRELPNTNPALYREITGGKTQESTGEEEDEPIEYGSDIPVEVITAQIVSGGSVTTEGFEVDGDGSIVRTGVAEETGG